LAIDRKRVRSAEVNPGGNAWNPNLRSTAVVSAYAANQGGEVFVLLLDSPCVYWAEELLKESTE